jgi:uncharacterized protein YyaL (SSP411 family)
MSTTKAEINWRSWSPETLKVAELENKPVLLAITATWCHWCHVMDHTTFGDEQVAAVVNEKFIPIRADNDRRPDLNARYNMGGWPTVAFLTSAGDILTGATYLPARQMTDLLNRVSEVYSEERQLLADRAREMRQKQQEELAHETDSTALLTEHIPENVMRSVQSSYDPLYGGFGTQQKFPHIAALEFLLTYYRRKGNNEYIEVAAQTLDAMKDGGLYDEVERGFFRYSTTRDWRIPHYEKMLEDNAGLLSDYILAYNVTGEERFLDTAKSVMRYLESTLLNDETRAFSGSQDADEEYYNLPGEMREKRQHPSVDRTVYVNWNGAAAESYLNAYEATGDHGYRDRAIEIIEFLLESCRQDGGFFHYHADGPKEPGMLIDQTHAGRALVAAYECTGSRSYLDAARQTAEHIQTYYADPRGGFFDITEERRRNESLPRREKQLDENAVAARFLNRLSYYAFEPKYRFAAEAALRQLASSYDSYGILASTYALAVMEVIEEPVRVAIAGPREDPRTEALLNSALKAREPSSLVQILGEESDEADMRDFLMEPSDQPRASVCLRDLCRVSSDPTEVVKAIHEAESKHK